MEPSFLTPKSNIHTIAFYNLENLFDTEDDHNTIDDDFTPGGKKNWDEEKYAKKLYKLGSAIAKIGTHKNESPPAIVGLAEVENRDVVKDLIASKELQHHDFDLVHYDSPDERGIDVALIYQKQFFEVITTNVIPLLLYNEEGERDYTRDILHVEGLLNNETIHIMVNHWPSRRSGANETSGKRIKAAKTLKNMLEEIKEREHNPNFIIMGDFNDDPHSDSIKNHLLTSDLYNPMEKLLSPFEGSLNYRGEWNLFDQIIFSNSFFKFEKGTHQFAHADVFDDHFLTEWKGRYEGNPFRTYSGRKYLGGYSDHFPVYIQLKLI